MRTNARRHRATAPTSTAARDRRGFTLVELIVGMVLLTIGVMGLVGVSALSIRQSTTADRHSVAANVAASRMERLRALPCASIAAGSATTRGITESWTILATTTTSRRVRGTFTYRKPPRNTLATLTVETTIQC